MAKFASLIVGFLCIVSCSSDLPTAAQKPPPQKPDNKTFPAIEPLSFPDEWSKKTWIDKASRALRNGDGFSKKDDMTKLMQLSSDQIVDVFMQDPRFAEMVMDFTMYFQGTKAGQLKPPTSVTMPDGTTKIVRRFDFQAFEYPGAITAAKEIEKNGNFLKFLEIRQPYYTSPLDLRKGDNGVIIPIEQTMNDMSMQIDKTLEAIAATPNNFDLICNHAYAIVEEFRKFDFNNPLGTEFFSITENSIFYLIVESCFSKNLQQLKNQLLQFKGRLPALQAALKEIEFPKYEATTVSSIKAMDTSSLSPNNTQPFRFLFWTRQTNSSTNKSRKRAAYMLKTYFCDDLTPINVVDPGSHTGGKHGSEASCFACHYKLDPMAGFFKTTGLYGHDYSKSPIMIFDDSATVATAEYVKEWQNPAGSSRVWNIGYVRSQQYPELNIYGESLEDLFQIVQTAPEVKQCIVRRLTQYLLSEKQVLDQKYLTMLQDEFIENTKSNSSVALKQTIKRVLHTKVYSHPNPQDDSCYDFVPGDNPSNKPPCKVAFVFEKNCASCHQGASAAAGLDLTGWIQTSDGKMGFPHRIGNGQVPSALTFQAISERLSTSDPGLRMPLGKYISSADQELLYLWVQSMGAQR